MAGVKGRSGRHPQPTVLKLVQGGKSSQQKAKKRGGEPVPASSAKCPSPPSYLTDTAKDYWKKHAKDLWEVGLLTRSDLTAWEQTCEAYAEVRHAQEEKKKGLYVQDPTVPRKKNGEPMAVRAIKNPYYAIEKDAFKRLTSMLDRFGMNPSSRARVGTGDRPPGAGEGAGEGKPAGGKWGGFLPDVG